MLLVFGMIFTPAGFFVGLLAYLDQRRREPPDRRAAPDANVCEQERAWREGDAPQTANGFNGSGSRVRAYDQPKQ